MSYIYNHVPRAGPDRPRPEVAKFEGGQMEKILHIKLLFIRFLGFMWRTQGMNPCQRVRRCVTKKISAEQKKTYFVSNKNYLGAKFSSWPEAQSGLGTALKPTPKIRNK